MSENKMKVKDLATELGVPSTEVLRVMRELGTPAKSSASPIPEDALPRVREQFSAAKANPTDERREVQPGVILRRRSRKKDDDDTMAQDTPTAGEQQSENRVAKVSDDAPATETETATTEATTKDAPADTASKSEAKPERKKKPAAPRVPAPAAKVISRPTDPVVAQPAEKVEPTAEADGRAEAQQVQASSAAEQNPVVEQKSETAAAEQTPRAATSEAVKSKATEETPASEASQPDAKPAAMAEKTEERQVRVNKARPAASASPEGSSAPSLLPPVSESRTAVAGNDDERKNARRPQDASTPQVRIISRPDPAQAAARRATEGTRDNRDAGRDNRGDGGRFARPGGTGAPRPAGAGAPRPAGAGAPRPAGAGAPRPAGGRPGGAPGAGFTPAGTDSDSGREGQSKKKRNKNQNRRGGDFQQNDTAGRRRDDDDSDMPRSRGRRRSKSRDDRKMSQSTQPLKAAKRKIRVEEAIRVADMAHQMGIKSSEIIKVLFKLGVMATINEALDLDTAGVVAAEFGYEAEKVGFTEEDYLAPVEADTPESLKRRPPVVTIMGHVDHGKTSLLDAIRKTNVTGGEAGGITQHIGAYHVRTKNGEIVFLDTPGHEAFTAMRARGAQVTDLVVLVVAADDGVMEQTREAVNHSRAAGVPIMVAVNKIDKEAANPDRVLRELAEVGLVPESWGGDTVVSLVSAKSREGLDDLLEMLALQADILDLKANPDKPARGHIVEAKLDKGRGPVATVLIQEGTLHQGDNFVCGVFSGRVRAMFNDQGRKVKEAGPSIPVEVQGFDGVPEAGEEFVCLTDEKLARRIAETRAVKQRERELAKESRVTLETFLSRKKSDQEALVLNLVVKADVQGSLEAIIEALKKQSTEKVRIQVIHGGAGAITESDILLASASDAIVIGFNVRPTAKVKEVAERENVDIRFYDIIYKLIDEIKSAMAGLLAPVSREVYLGQADVRQVFSVPKAGSVAGCHISDGKILRSAGIRLLRDGVVVHTGKISSLRRFKDDIREVMKGYECGIGIENYNDIKVGDVIEAFDTVTEAATL